MFFPYFFLVLHLLSLLGITIFCLMQFVLYFYYKKHLSRGAAAFEHEKYPITRPNLPFVTIQLPVFNERYVVERLLETISHIQYPLDRLEVQVLDDSTDDTVELVAQKVSALQKRGFPIQHIHRTNRNGYKAGALKDAMSQAKGEFIAIFDADFVPIPDFLLRTLPPFQDERVGVVQTRWEHLNEDYNLLTRLQAMQLNVHFTVEQSGRQAANALLQFNGTAGVWRRTAMEAGGGWQADTLTEDLDLSLRTQKAGFRIVFLEGVGSPAELPVEMNGLKGQQFRWNKGGAQNARKHLRNIWADASVTLKEKILVTGHFMAFSTFLWIFLAAISSIPLVFLLQNLPIPNQLLTYPLLGLIAIIVVFYTANITAVEARTGQKVIFLKKLSILGHFMLFLPISMGLCFYTGMAVLEGFLGKTSGFVRTPKFGIVGTQHQKTSAFQSMRYLTSKISWITWCEGGFSIIFLALAIYGMAVGQLTFLALHTMLALGFGTVFGYSVAQLQR